MPGEKSPGKPMMRRYTDIEKAQAVRLVRELRKELGTDHGTVYRVANQLGYVLAGNPQVTGLRWEFFVSFVTGKGVPTGPLARALEEAGIPYVVHP